MKEKLLIFFRNLFHKQETIPQEEKQSVVIREGDMLFEIVFKAIDISKGDEHKVVQIILDVTNQTSDTIGYDIVAEAIQNEFKDKGCCGVSIKRDVDGINWKVILSSNIFDFKH